jgi:hypothetical protein
MADQPSAQDTGALAQAGRDRVRQQPFVLDHQHPHPFIMPRRDVRAV